MRDTFYCWLAVLILFAIFFGSAVERAKTGDVSWYEIGMSALLGAMAAAALTSHYRAARLAAAPSPLLGEQNG